MTPGKTKHKVLVGLSGGVDSAMSAMLLKKQGYEVAGAFIKGWYPPGIVCDWKKEREDAQRIALLLNIPFITIDLSREYKRFVVDYLFENYKLGLTPNPDIMCNNFIKFGSFLQKAKKLGFEYIATGHYARKVKRQGAWALLRGRDKEKDQSYFLWTLTQKKLSDILFPVGNLQKKEVRVLAKKYGLPVADKRDSVGICFLGEMDMKTFLLQKIKTKKGEIKDLEGRVLGEHEGIPFYTITQRITLPGQKEPFYVIHKDVKQNILWVAPRSQLSKIGARKTTLDLLNWVRKPPKLDQDYGFVPRYRAKPIKARVIKLDKEICVLELSKKLLLSPGQFGVLYQRDEVVGGGRIVNSDIME